MRYTSEFLYQLYFESEQTHEPFPATPLNFGINPGSHVPLSASTGFAGTGVVVWVVGIGENVAAGAGVNFTGFATCTTVLKMEF